MLGLACGLARRRPVEPEPGDEMDEQAADSGRFIRRPPALAVAAVLALAATVSFAAPWLAERSVQKAARTWPDNPTVAFDRLDSAARLNPLSDRPPLIEGSIALRVNDIARARQAFQKALDRNERGAYAALELGAIASMDGRRTDAESLLRRASLLSPRDVIARGALRRVQAGKRVDVDELNREILLRASRLTQ
jgi:tetratricopeptide (TPR) repeat protein